jgi:hypothetical protein
MRMRMRMTGIRQDYFIVSTGTVPITADPATTLRPESTKMSLLPATATAELDALFAPVKESLRGEGEAAIALGPIQSIQV